jgi:hypothetical protein
MDILIPPSPAIVESPIFDTAVDVNIDDIEGYHYNTQVGAWVHDACGAFVAWPVTHTEWHKVLMDSLVRAASQQEVFDPRLIN